MKIDHATLRLPSHLKPRKVLSSIVDRSLPIRGGWGYTKDDATIIDRFDEVLDDPLAFDGYAVQKLFVQNRIYLELIGIRPEEDRYAGIDWDLIDQAHLTIGGRDYDRLRFAVRFFRHSDWQLLEGELDGAEDTPGSNGGELLRRLESQALKAEVEYWFDITSLFSGPAPLELNVLSDEEKALFAQRLTPQRFGNAVLLDPVRNLWRILDCITIRMPRFTPQIPFKMLARDTRIPGVLGTDFEYVDPSTDELGASISVVDATPDPDEPFVPDLTPEDLPSLDADLSNAYRRMHEDNETAITEWVPVSLRNEFGAARIEVRYLENDDGRMYQHLDLRFSVQDRRIVVLGKALADDHDQLLKVLEVVESVANQ